MVCALVCARLGGWYPLSPVVFAGYRLREWRRRGLLGVILSLSPLNLFDSLMCMSEFIYSSLVSRGLLLRYLRVQNAHVRAWVQDCVEIAYKVAQTHLKLSMTCNFCYTTQRSLKTIPMFLLKLAKLFPALADSYAQYCAEHTPTSSRQTLLGGCDSHILPTSIREISPNCVAQLRTRC